MSISEYANPPASSVPEGVTAGREGDGNTMVQPLPPARGSTPAWAVDQFERAALGPDWFQFAEIGAPGGEGSVSISDGHNAQGDFAVDSLAGYSPFAPTAGSAYACIQDAGSIDGQEACVCLGVDAAAGDALCCCLKSEGPTKFEMFGWQNGTSINPVPPANLAHSIGDFMAITRTSANTFRCQYAASGTPTMWSDLTGDVTVNNITNPGRGGVYFYSDGERAAQFEVGHGSAPPTAHVCGAVTAPPGGTATATPPATPTRTPLPPGGTATATPPATPTRTPFPVPGCPLTPAMGCFGAGKGKLLLTFNPDPARRTFLWKWSGGTTQLSQADFGDPVNGSTSYTLCVYDQTAGFPTLKMSVSIIAGGTCHGRPCWKPLADSGWRYKDLDSGAKMALKGGAAGTPRVMFKQKKSLALPPPVSGTKFLNQDTAVIVQLHGSTPANCWSSTFDQSGTRKNDGAHFRATTP